MDWLGFAFTPDGIVSVLSDAVFLGVVVGVLGAVLSLVASVAKGGQ